MAIQFPCPACGHVLSVPDRAAGRSGACPECNAVIDVPTVSAVAPEPPPSPPAEAEDEEAAPPPLMGAKRESIKVEDLVDMTAMVDIVFFLLIFFLVTSMQGVISSLGMPNPDQQKAAAKGAPAAGSSAAGFTAVRIDQDSLIILDGEEITSEQELRVKLRALHDDGGANKLLVQAHGDAQYSTVVMVLDSGNDVGMEEVRLAVVDDEGGER